MWIQASHFMCWKLPKFACGYVHITTGSTESASDHNQQSKALIGLPVVIWLPTSNWHRTIGEICDGAHKSLHRCLAIGNIMMLYRTCKQELKEGAGKGEGRGTTIQEGDHMSMASRDCKQCCHHAMGQTSLMCCGQIHERRLHHGTFAALLATV